MSSSGYQPIQGMQLCTNPNPMNTALWERETIALQSIYDELATLIKILTGKIKIPPTRKNDVINNIKDGIEREMKDCPQAIGKDLHKDLDKFLNETTINQDTISHCF